MLSALTLEQFCAFEQARIEFSPGLNVVAGENGAGKSHLLKLGYSALHASHAAFADEALRNKQILSRQLGSKLRGVFGVQAVGRLARRVKGGITSRVRVELRDAGAGFGFEFSNRSQLDVKLDPVPAAYASGAPVFVPPKEILSTFGAFRRDRDLDKDALLAEFDDTYRDLADALAADPKPGRRDLFRNTLATPIEDYIGGSVVLDDDRFTVRLRNEGSFEVSLVAEGLRKAAMLLRLLINGALRNRSVLFWDEPEANVNPRLLRVLAEAIFVAANQQGCLAGAGTEAEDMQVVVATHSFFLLKEFELLGRRWPQARPVRFVGLVRDDERTVRVEQGDRLSDLHTIVALEEETAQYDRERELLYAAAR